MAMKGEQINQTRALRMLCAAIFGRNNPTSTDFEDVGVWKVQRNYEQDKNGILIQFSVAWNAIGKVQSAEVSGALEVPGLSDDADD